MKRLLLAASIALLLSPAAAFAAPAAQGHGHGHGHEQRQSQRQDYHRDRRDYNDRRVVVRRPVVVRHDVYVRHDNGRHLGWARGQRMPVVYLQPRYYVNDYRGYGLAPPPYGYRWVRPYNDAGEYLLVQVATGLIAQVFGGY